MAGMPLPRPSFYPRFLKFFRTPADLSADTDTTEVPEDLVVTGALASLEGILAAKLGGHWEADARMHSAEYNRLLRHYGFGKPTVTVIEQKRVFID